MYPKVEQKFPWYMPTPLSDARCLVTNLNFINDFNG